MGERTKPLEKQISTKLPLQVLQDDSGLTKLFSNAFVGNRKKEKLSEETFIQTPSATFSEEKQNYFPEE